MVPRGGIEPPTLRFSITCSYLALAVTTDCRRRAFGTSLEPFWGAIYLSQVDDAERCKIFNELCGGRNRARTCDPLIKSQPLFQRPLHPRSLSRCRTPL